MKLRIFSFFKLSTLRQRILRTIDAPHRIAECAVVSVSTRGKFGEIAIFFFFLAFDIFAHYSSNERRTASYCRMRCRFSKHAWKNWRNCEFFLFSNFRLFSTVFCERAVHRVVLSNALSFFSRWKYEFLLEEQFRSFRTIYKTWQFYRILFKSYFYYKKQFFKGVHSIFNHIYYVRYA